MRRFEETLQLNKKPFNGFVTDYSKVVYLINEQEVHFNTEQLINDLERMGYDNMHISLLLEAIHHHDGAIHIRTKQEDYRPIKYFE